MQEPLLSLSAQGKNLNTLVAQASKFLEAAKAQATRKSYASDGRDFAGFCAAHSLPYLASTPDTLALYIGDLASRGLAVATIKRRIAAISYLHTQAGYGDSPASPKKHFVVREVLAGIKRTLGTTQYGVEPLMGDAIRRIVAACPLNLLGLRDRALLVLGFAIGARRSELCSILEVCDLTFTEQGDLYIRMRRGKADQEQSGRTIAVGRGEHPETCPVRALRAWLEASRIDSGFVFRAVDRHGNVSSTSLNPRSLSKILKVAACRAGLATASVSPHGLRFGMCTQAAIMGPGSARSRRPPDIDP
jgi:site-specific recombinase XerD